jgi:hypothetical protein
VREHDSDESVARAMRAKGQITLRRERSERLSRYLDIVRGSCPIHLVASRRPEVHEPGGDNIDNDRNKKGSISVCQLQLDSATRKIAFPFKKFLDFKHGFRYEPYTYCHYCGSPQDHKGNQEAPASHRQAGYGGSPCPWSDFPYAVVFSIWHTNQAREEMMAHFQLEGAMSYDEFVAWCRKTEPGKGEYTKMLEVFLWHCEKLLGY